MAADRQIPIVDVPITPVMPDLHIFLEVAVISIMLKAGNLGGLVALARIAIRGNWKE